MITKPSKIRPLFMQCSIYFFILHLLLQFSIFQGISRFFVRPIVRNISIVAHFYWKLTKMHKMHKISCP